MSLATGKELKPWLKKVALNWRRRGIAPDRGVPILLAGEDFILNLDLVWFPDCVSVVHLSQSRNCTTSIPPRGEVSLSVFGYKLF